MCSARTLKRPASREPRESRRAGKHPDTPGSYAKQITPATLRTLRTAIRSPDPGSSLTTLTFGQWRYLQQALKVANALGCRLQGHGLTPVRACASCDLEHAMNHFTGERSSCPARGFASLHWTPRERDEPASPKYIRCLETTRRRRETPRGWESATARVRGAPFDCCRISRSSEAGSSGG
jgi:hypothetical protein